jgi:uncharacterized protein YecE (DUF72 family)
MASHRYSTALRIGISGWRYEPWRGTFYPRGLPARDELAYASRQVPTIEINGTFYSLQRPEYFAEWRDQTPDGFVFAVKGSRFLTHTRRLKDIEVPFANFLASGLFELREKLGPILWQFPPTMRWDPQRFEAFFRLLPRSTGEAARLARRHDARLRNRDSVKPHADMEMRHAVEIRHESFCDAGFVDMLRHYNVALVTADTAGRWPLLEDSTADFAYVRLHGDKELYASGYTPRAISHWADRIDAWAHGRQPRDARRAGSRQPRGRPRDVYCYFDNDTKVMAPRDARALMQALGLPLQPTALDPPASR